ncbi:ATP-grasp fold amidoligase family protein [Acuticoccus sediminis]|uniref:ATP-grasp fold amidoligase family protein n=1 Tax=Acuticoccus sediminis TaxID=2184697 RepID=UPI001CFE6C2E|nr:ATP-grasp fold amidoligase family protein [Acuticoccus sediminis]
MALRETITALCLKQLGREPNLEAPAGYNDKIQWLKLHDQRPAHVPSCDKIAVRKIVAETVGPDVLIERHPWPPVSFPCVAKASHDSGSASVVRSELEAVFVEAKLKKRLARPYGVDKGEWAYAFITPRVIVERALPGEIVDFKFHCVHGAVRWVQVIWDRASGKPREAIHYPDGALSDLHMDEKMVSDPMHTPFPGPEAWAALSDLAERLAAPWRYVRVDLYWSERRPWFGELTFWPRAGCYRSPDEPAFGRLLEIDLTDRHPPIVS